MHSRYDIEPTGYGAAITNSEQVPYRSRHNHCNVGCSLGQVASTIATASSAELLVPYYLSTSTTRY